MAPLFTEAQVSHFDLMSKSPKIGDLTDAIDRYGKVSIEIYRRVKELGFAIRDALPKYLGLEARVFGVPPYGYCCLRRTLQTSACAWFLERRRSNPAIVTSAIKGRLAQHRRRKRQCAERNSRRLETSY